MTSKMQITAILLKNYRQFRSLYLPLVDPETDEPLQNVCFIGVNATGKSTLLALISSLLHVNHKLYYNRVYPIPAVCCG